MGPEPVNFAEYGKFAGKSLYIACIFLESDSKKALLTFRPDDETGKMLSALLRNRYCETMARLIS
jgi:hypothetical protein